MSPSIAPDEHPHKDITIPNPNPKDEKASVEAEMDSKAVSSSAQAKLQRPKEGPDAPVITAHIDGTKMTMYSQRDFEEKLGKFGAVAVKRKAGFFEQEDPEMLFDYRRLIPGKRYTMVKLPTLDRIAHPPGPSKPMDFTVNLNLNLQVEPHTRILVFYGFAALLAAVAMHALANITIALIQ